MTSPGFGTTTDCLWNLLRATIVRRISLKFIHRIWNTKKGTSFHSNLGQPNMALKMPKNEKKLLRFEVFLCHSQIKAEDAH